MTSKSDNGWDWELSPRAETQFSRLDSEVQERINAKLDEVVSSEWRDPEDFLDPVANSPYQKLRIGAYRLGCRLSQTEQTLRVESIRDREGAYDGDD